MSKKIFPILASIALADAILDTLVFGKPYGLFGENAPKTKKNTAPKPTYSSPTASVCKSNFTDLEIGVVSNNLPNGMSLSVNKCGNIALHHKYAPSNIFFNIYKRKNGNYIIRKRLSVAKHFENVGGIMNNGEEFSTLESLMAFLNEYAVKYPSRMWARAREKA